MKVSVIIPTYNRSNLVIKTLETVFNQTFTDREIIIVDDGSTDDTETALLPYLDRITYIRQENLGVNAARNTALEVAAGEYIALLDSDDLWMDFKLALEVEVLDANPDVGFVFSDFIVAKSENENVRNGLKAWYTLENDWEKLFRRSTHLPTTFASAYPELQCESFQLYFGDIYYSSLYHPAVLPSASLYRRSKAPSGRVFNEDDSTCGDWEFFARLSHAHGAAFIEMETTFNRIHEDAVRLTRLDASIQLRRQIDLVRRIWCEDDSFMSKYSEQVLGRLYQLYCDLIWEMLISGDPTAAKARIKDFESLGFPAPDGKLSSLDTIASTPGATFVLRILRKIKHRLRG